MRETIPQEESLLQLLETVAEKSGHRTALAGGKFKRDYGNVLYLTQNRARANQLNIRLAQEVTQTDERTIIPPAVLPYTAGFVRLAALAKFGYVDTVNVCRYSDEWFNLFLYEVAKRVVGEELFKDRCGTTDNKRANLAKDFRVFIRDTVLCLKTEKADGPLGELSETEDLFLAAYRAYREAEKNFPDSDNRFMHPLQAYEYLYSRRHETALNKVIIVEDEELLEPLFREILQHINCPVYVLTDTPATDGSYKQKTDLYHFMTPLDEAEFVGWGIKKLLADGTPSTDIGVVCADRACKEVLDAVFKRMDIAGEQQLPLASNGYYRLVKMLFGLICREEGASFSARALFDDDKSKFKLGKGYYVFRKILSNQGLKTQLFPADALLKSIKEFTDSKQNDPAYKKDIEALAKLKALLEKKHPCVCEIAEAALRDPKDNKTHLNDILSALHEMDENLKTERELGGEAFMQKARALFGVLDGRELNTPRETLALEQGQADEADADDTDAEWEPQANYSFSVVAPEAAKTLRVKHLFLCGFNAEADKTGLLCYPNALAEKLELPTLNEKKLRAAHSVAYALNYAAHTAVTYGYLNLEGKESAESALIQLLGQVLPKEKQHTGQDNHLLKSYEVIEKDMPDPSWTGVRAVKRIENHLGDFIKKLFNSTQTCGKLLEQIKVPDAQTNLRHIGAREFADFIICPSKFFFTQLAKNSGMKTDDAESIRHMSKGLFWHEVFERAAATKDFYSKDEARIKAALECVLKNMIEDDKADEAEQKSLLGKFTDGNRDAFFAQAREEVLPLFARNEAARQQKFGLCKWAGLEEKFAYPIPKCGFAISGKVDRKDQRADGELFFWDYKTGNPKTEPLKFYSQDKSESKQDKATQEKTFKLEPKEEALQLALYMYCHAQKQAESQPQPAESPQAQAENPPQPPKLRAGNIFINGKDNAGKQAYDAILADLLNKQMDAFVQALGQKLPDLPRDNKVEDGIGGKCTYCQFKGACKLISMHAGGNK